MVPITDNTVVVDFEAYLTAPLILSEIGCVRIQNGEIVAKVHGFFQLSQEQIQQMKGTNQIGIAKVEKLTRIPVPWKPSYDNVKPLITDLQQFIQTFKVFTSGSSTEIRALNSEFVEILQDFEAQQCTIAAKGCQMEQQVMKTWGLDSEVFEVIDVFFQQNKQEMEFENIHGERQFDYCNYHTLKVQQVKESQMKQMSKLSEVDRKKQEQKMQNAEAAHCALDDVMYLAKKFAK
uniref:Exonuclease family protein n=1 Tax=Trepomonas sp. PC1 TaxID=1076344 RepID=A0A146K631_9EUKA|eukprot:JAP90969.1 Hypothetical protein TPC1_17562 [Trepomonas sp. PC1]